MTFKTVHGLGREEYAIKALNMALQNMHTPAYVDSWVEWFDKHQGDKNDALVEFTAQCKTHGKSGACTDNCDMHAVHSSHAYGQCTNCGVTVACPDDCPQPEFYAGDLEEVAHAVAARTEAAISAALLEMGYHANPQWLTGLFDGIRAEIATPGYVEGLLPE